VRHSDPFAVPIQNPGPEPQQAQNRHHHPHHESLLACWSPSSMCREGVEPPQPEGDGVEWSVPAVCCRTERADAPRWQGTTTRNSSAIARRRNAASVDAAVREFQQTAGAGH